MKGNDSTARPWWKNWKIWAAVFAVAAVGSALDGGKDEDKTVELTPSPTVEATVAPSVTPADIEAAKVFCMRDELPASGAVVEPVVRDVGIANREWMQEPTDEGQTVEDVAKTVVLPTWEKASGGKWLDNWLTARRLDGTEPTLHAKVKGADSSSGTETWYDCWAFVTSDGTAEGWVNVAG